MTSSEMLLESFFTKLMGMPMGDLYDIQATYWLAEKAHFGQKRDDGKDYITHPVEVAELLLQRHYSSKGVIQKALLHDAFEDTDIQPYLVEMVAGYNVRYSALLLSKITQEFSPLTGRLIGRHRKTDEQYYGAIAVADREDRVVKLADNVKNMSSMGIWPKDRRVKYAEKTEKWLLPIARATDEWFADRLQALVDRELK